MGTCLYLLKHDVSTCGKLRTLFIFYSMGIDGIKLLHEIFGSCIAANGKKKFRI